MTLKPILLSLLLIFTCTQSGMAVDIYMRIVGQNQFADPNIPEALSRDGFFRLGSVSIGVENVVNIGSISTGGGAGKAIFKELQITKWPGKVSTDIFKKLVTGSHYQEVEIIMVRRTIDLGAPISYVMTFGMKLVMAQSLDYSVSEGDDIPEEQIVLQFGAIRVRYYEVDPKTGASTKYFEEVWSRVLNNASYSVQ